MSKLKLTYDTMLTYLKNSFSNKERHALERKVMQDPFEAEAFEELSNLSAEAFESDLQKLQTQLKQYTQKRKLLLWKHPMAIAASFLILLSLGLFLFRNNNPNEPYNVVDNTNRIEERVVVTETEKTPMDNPEKEERFIEPVIINKEPIVVVEEVKEIHKNRINQKPASSKKTNSKQLKETPIVAKDIIVESEVAFELEEAEFEEEESVVYFEVEVEAEEEKLVSNIITWSGVITDNYGMPLSGVSVIIKNSDRGVATDFDGRYSIEASKEVVLEVHYIGFETTEITFDGHEKVSLSENLAALDEVVVVGYGAGRTKNTSVAKVKSADLPKKEQIVTNAIPPQGNEALFKRWVMTQLNPTIFESGKQYNITINYIIDEKGKVTKVKTPTVLKSSIKKHLKAIMLSGLNWSPAQIKNGTIKESKVLVLWFHF